MKRWIFLALAVGIVVGAGALLLTTRQAPDVETPATFERVEDTQLPDSASDLSGAKHLSTEEFRALGAEVMKALPRKEDLQKIKAEESNGTPPALIAAGVELGKISEAAANEPALEAEAVTLYRECAASPQHPDSVRALCFSNYKRLAQKTGAPVDEAVASKAIRQLAEKLEL